MAQSMTRVRLGPLAVWSWVLGTSAVLLAVGRWLPAPFRAIEHWQQDALGSAFPATTALVLAGIVILPVALARQPGEAAGSGGRLARLWGLRRFRLLAVLSAALAAAIGVLPLLWAGDPGGAPRAIDLDSARAIAPGPISLSGFRAAAGELREVSGPFDGGHAVRYLAVVPARAPAGTAAHVVVQLRDDGLAFDPQTVPTALVGLALSNALPAAVASELRARGAVAAGDSLVVFTDPAEPNRPAWQRARELALAALVLAGFAAVVGWSGLRGGAPDERKRSLA